MTDTSDVERFENLFQTHHQAIFRYCVRRLGVPDAEDATADVFVVAWRRRAEIPEGDAGRAWLYGVAFRAVGNRYRTARRQNWLKSRVRNERQATAPEAGITQSDVLFRALSRLKTSDREILQLSAWDGLDRGEIAQVLGINENAADQRLHRARGRLRIEYGKVSGGSVETWPKEAST